MRRAVPGLGEGAVSRELPFHVRFTPESGHSEQRTECLLCANSGHRGYPRHVPIVSDLFICPALMKRQNDSKFHSVRVVCRCMVTNDSHGAILIMPFGAFGNATRAALSTFVAADRLGTVRVRSQVD